jgi:hypothetical protein
MGKYKRTKSKPKKQKRFANVEMILALIREHKDKIENLPATTIQLEKREIEWGDEWDSETGYEYLIFFSDKSAYLVGETQVIEDREDYAQADSWQQSHCRDYYQERSVPCLEVLEKLEAVVL